MFTKVHLALYNMLFDFYGKIGERYYQKALEVNDEFAKSCLMEKAWKCFDKREDILDIMFTLKGLN